MTNSPMAGGRPVRRVGETGGSPPASETAGDWRRRPTRSLHIRPQRSDQEVGVVAIGTYLQSSRCGRPPWILTSGSLSRQRRGMRRRLTHSIFRRGPLVRGCVPGSMRNYSSCWKGTRTMAVWVCRLSGCGSPWLKCSRMARTSEFSRTNRRPTSQAQTSTSYGVPRFRFDRSTSFRSRMGLRSSGRRYGCRSRFIAGPENESGCGQTVPMRRCSCSHAPHRPKCIGRSVSHGACGRPRTTSAADLQGRPDRREDVVIYAVGASSDGGVVAARSRTTSGSSSAECGPQPAVRSPPPVTVTAFRPSSHQHGTT